MAGPDGGQRIAATRAFFAAPESAAADIHMRSNSDRDTLLTRRLKEVERELDSVRRDMKVHSRTLRRADVRPMPSGLRTPKPRVEAPPSAPPPSPSAGKERPEAGSAAGLPAAERDSGADAERVVGGSDRGYPRPDTDRRFANYFVSGNMDSVRPLRQETRIWRNKAIAMIVVVLLVLVWVLWLIFR